MKGNISLKDFIKQVKSDLKSAIDEDDPFFVLDDVELEASFVLNTDAKGGAKLIVAEVGASVKAEQTHKVTLKLKPFVEETLDEPSPPSPKAKKGPVKRPSKSSNSTVTKKMPAKKAKVKRKPVLKKA